MRCPNCKQTVEWEGNPYRPFCSERCQMIDLDNWLEGRYKVPSVADPEDEESLEGGSAGTKGERE
jgi:uncharacterized protein